jgi:hypothetical protein
MIVLLDTSHDLAVCAAELGCDVGQLLTPLSKFRLRDPSRSWAIDNGAFANFESSNFLGLLGRNQDHRQSCLFVTAPDVVGSARRTLEVFEHWKAKLAGWPIALACQDGQENLPIPWDDIAAIFIGGSTNWKCSHHAVHIIKAAQAIGKHVHVGRINGPERFKHFEELGVDTIDGTGIAQYSHMREAIKCRHQQGELYSSPPISPPFQPPTG